MNTDVNQNLQVQNLSSKDTPLQVQNLSFGILMKEYEFVSSERKSPIE